MCPPHPGKRPMTKPLEVPTACGPIASPLVAGTRLSREDSAALAATLEARQEGLDALESLARAVGTCPDNLPRTGTLEARHLDVPLCLAIEALRARQAETRDMMKALA